MLDDIKSPLWPTADKLRGYMAAAELKSRNDGISANAIWVPGAPA